MKNFLFFVFLLLTYTCNASAERILLIGHFSSLQTTQDEDPHTVSGYRVSLYKSGASVFGSFAAATGSLETAQGRLYDVHFEPATGRLSFKSRLAMGWESSREIGPNGRESRAIYEFRGRLQSRSLVGNMVQKDWNSPHSKPIKEKAVLPKTRDAYVPESIEEWLSHTYLDHAW